MNILTNWLRHYLPTLPVTDRQLADDLTLRGIAVEGVHSLGPNNGHLFEMDITTNRVDAMNHYGIAREAATTFVRLAMRHPTHALHLDKLEGGIIVRLARKGEKLKLLDGTERILESDDLVIADEKKAVGLAGVMGGWDTMITGETKNILIEAAWFDPITVRRSGRRHGLHTDASHRFERGADFNAPPVANALVSNLILQRGGHPEGPLIDVVLPQIAARTASRPPLQLAAHPVHRH